MTAMTPDWLNALALLDEALAQSPTQLEPWLASMAASRPGAIPLLRKLISAHGRVLSRDILATLPKLHGAARVLDAGAAGLRVGPFELVEPIGQGGMGSVWRARYADGRLKREVAVKLPAASSDRAALDSLRERFARERDFLAQLEHPLIARLYDAGVSESGQPYLAMEYVVGLPINAHCDMQRLSMKARLKLFLQVLDAVGHAHQQLVLHRDLKASNVLVDEQGQVRLLDFGVARLLPPLDDALIPAGAQADAASDLTERAGAAFTLGHAAPEQITHGALSTATDVYALGVMLYHLLTGLSPYQPARDTRGALEDAVLLATPEAASTRAYPPQAAEVREGSAAALRKALRGDLDVVLGKALKKSPAERYPTVQAMADDLRRHLAQQPIGARADGWSYRARLFLARNATAVVASALACVVLIGTAGTAVWQARVSARNAALATKEAVRANTVQKFFAGLLSNADPEKNKNITAVDRQLVDHALKTAERDFAAAPEMLALVLKQLAEIYVRLDAPAKVLEVQKKRVELLQAMQAPPPDDFVQAQIELARALSSSSVTEERAQALPKAMAAYALSLTSRGSDDLVISALCLIADMHTADANYSQADKFATQAVAHARRSKTVAKAALSLALANKGIAIAKLGDFDAARLALREAIAMDNSGQGRSKVEQIHTRHALATVEFDAGRYETARQEYMALVDFGKQDLGAMDGTLTSARVRAVFASLSAGDFAGGSRMVQQHLGVDLSAAEPFRVAIAHYTKGVAAMLLGQFDDAEQDFLVAAPGLVIRPKWALGLAVHRAELSLRRNQPAAAQSALSPLLEEGRAQGRLATEDYEKAFERFGVALARQQDVAAAQTAFEKACAGRRARLKSSHPLRVRCETYIGLIDERLSPEDKRRALLQQLALLKGGSAGPTALMPSMEKALVWVADQPKDSSRTAQHLALFPLLN